jgi:hypothetical protein
VNFQVTVLKILVSYPDGFALMSDLKRDMAILATSGRDWSERTKRLAARVPDLDIFSQGLVERLNGGWRISEKGRGLLEFMEARRGEPESGKRTTRSRPAAGATSSRLSTAWSRRTPATPPSRPRPRAGERLPDRPAQRFSAKGRSLGKNWKLSPSRGVGSDWMRSFGA